MAGDTVRLYTRQNDKTLLMLEHGGRILNQRVYVQLHFGDMAKHYLECYDWFSREAAKRVPKPDYAELPIWCAVEASRCLPPEPGTVVYVVDIPRKKVIYFDDGKWDYVLNHHYLPDSPDDAAAYKKHLAQRGFTNGFEFFEGRYANKYPEEMRLIKESWSRVFDVNMASPTLCGNIWEIPKESIVRIVRPGERITE